MPKYDLFSAINPFNSGYLSVSSLHKIYYEEVGKRDGKAVLFLHGGPGGGLLDLYRRFFDPQYYRVILFDQRGAGKSTPHGELRENNTWELIKDIEKLRKHLEVTNWLVVGGSWGSTLAIAYTISHPDSVSALILRGIFLCRKSEIAWFYQKGASHLFPEEWQKFLAPIPLTERSNLIKAYYKLLTSDDLEIRLKAALAWSRWEAATSKLIPSAQQIARFEDTMQALAFARIECHYFIHEIFMPSDGYLLKSIRSIQHIPCFMVQGRYDVVCPARTAWEVKQAWLKAELEIIDDAGHSISEPGIISKLIEFTERLKSL